MSVSSSSPEEGNSTAPEAGSTATNAPVDERSRAEIVEEPETSGTVFLTLVLLMLIFGFWVMMYVILIDQ